MEVVFRPVSADINLPGVPAEPCLLRWGLPYECECRALLESQEPLSAYTPPAFEVPRAPRYHAHIFGPVSRYPLDPKRTFNPPRAGIDDYRRLLSTLGLERAVVVHSGAYGTDISVTRDALLASEGKWRGIALVDRDVTRDALPICACCGLFAACASISSSGTGTRKTMSWRSRGASRGIRVVYPAAGRCAHLAGLCFRWIRPVCRS